MSFQYVPLSEGKEPAPPRRKSNRRAAVRYQCGPATAGRVVTADRQEFVRAWLIDLSREGVGLLMSRSLPVGQHVYIQIKSAANQKFELFARVARATQQVGGDWLLGLELINKLTDDELDALL